MSNQQPCHHAPEAAAHQQSHGGAHHFTQILHILPKSSCRATEIALSYLSFGALPNGRAQKRTG
ncbi:hypothetical protein FEM41_09345 [Jejubacter calystegiae]|uniref:Uncharacterized protein n=1 Tax=Jejubacter calystegiae TaxID=2579935 RepID=A0A4P8YGR3_9ENTR|nr:hypothetical protein FEM41_09345 [Jejubacter calystegiae]